MKSIKSLLMVLGSVSLIFLGACGNNNQASNSDSSSTTPKPAASTAQQTDAAKTESSLPKEKHSVIYLILLFPAIDAE